MTIHNDASLNDKNFKVLILRSEDNTKSLADQLATLLVSGSVWLSGDLGAGKTTLTRYWLQALGHKGAVKSPTYTLVEPYSIEQDDDKIKLVYHTDLYRVEDPEELSLIGFDEYLDDPNALIIIEWPSRADDYLPPPLLFIDITQGVDESRQVDLRLSKVGQAQGLDLSALQI
ncbi:tRNA (adenosine(37)-N6)-threonylcarbamoyltransferase complex ATPase subunit type 1 TsaE [Psychrobacter sp. M13]|uniref:tRNA (adenosine(37)-N6)-threonylcarbamoyltransferase complex ATPase subunit type 1 TsaE n=1 Tax=Psychrobacter sp. M13 TaxID=3067275 RepID=UPI00191AC676|nr:tRNA (adenosine(37)-N6)-threonylcarbamoyltransferase complex ATPase subunit type 1 TsaE [Psychrobacter sp. M13]WLP95570.1 tRNA (adenosine(37)-N6)-threonylcarbamoyltransferase complex ATPase subunit type 1 TsaE [Psychrobacter sp. M13]